MLVIERYELESELGTGLAFHACSYELDKSKNGAKGGGNRDLSERSSLDIFAKQRAAAGHRQPAKTPFEALIFDSEVCRFRIGKYRPGGTNCGMSFGESRHVQDSNVSRDRSEDYLSRSGRLTGTMTAGYPLVNN